MRKPGLSKCTTLEFPVPQLQNVVTGCMKNRGVDGQFSPTAMRNLTSRIQKEIDVISGVTPNMTQAEKIMNDLNE